ncbi:MAG: sugar phosphate isomerase/epimerase family protein [Candidatus Latescibacteria bacterium]|jgi:sugar phosphate isomerase/epimerase|nr:sugar phosphate isomerase/epimerase family protein [Candidatus Latescibacterota bacterium]MDP7447397.1 sugar phosphate isomerase/epimerase family protein [Candidatus Latescibacterota bacterium]HJP29287.1 sugar phosphate isomerase/epimerase family protein [Candidatus Latescibacterota bacterium]
MQIAYGTYAMPAYPLEEAAPMLADIGYDGVEICVSPAHPSSLPEEMDRTRRIQLRELLVDLHLGIPALFVTGHLLAESAAEHVRMQDHVKRCAELARQLGTPEPPVIAVGIGGRSADWQQLQDTIIDHLGAYATLGREEGCIIAAEAHFGAAVDRSERALHVIEAVNSPTLRLHFDIVHFYLSGEDEADAVEHLLPITAHTHITDARRHADGSFDLLLLGQGELDSTKYVKAMAEGGWDDFITLEVSKRLWAQQGYDAVEAARISYTSLAQAFDAAGVGPPTP